MGVKLKTVYSSLALSRADEIERRSILDFLGIDDPAGRIIPLLLSPELDGGFVACLSFVVRSHRGGGSFGPSGIPDDEGELIVSSG